MDIENKYDDVLVKYLLKETNAEEKQTIEEWLRSSENNRLYFQEFTNTLKLLSAADEIKKIDINQEWQHFQELKNKETQAFIPAQEDVDSEGQLYEAFEPAGRSKVYKLLIAGAIAASVILAILFGMGKFSGTKVENTETAKNEGPATNQSDSLPEVLMHEVNTSGKAKKFSLPDGTLVTLYAHSEFTYLQPEQGRTREVTLIGKAVFKVAKDKTRPFMVFTGEIYTTALGTEFLLTAMPKAKQMFVRLFEGSVVVRSNKNRKGKKMIETFLVPGQELIYTVTNAEVVVRSFFTDNEKASNQPENPLVNNDYKQPWFMFNNQSLPSIFDNLSKMYDVKIVYNKADFKKSYFIGKFDKNDSIEFILNQIAAINNLSITKENTTYTIKKQVLQPKN